MKNIFIIANKEFKDSLRNKWIIFTTLLLAVLSITLTLSIGSSSHLAASSLSVAIVNLSSLSIYLIPLIAILLSYDAIVGESERGTLLLLLSYPVSRLSILSGKLLGHLCILSFAIIVGFGCSVLISTMLHGMPIMQDILAFLQLIFSSILLGGVFISLSYMISCFVKERATAAGIGLFVWLLFVLLFDLTLIMILTNFENIIDEKTLHILMMFNPADIYRIINLTGFENIRMFSGLNSVTEYMALNIVQMYFILIAWLCLPLVIANIFFNKKEF